MSDSVINSKSDIFIKPEGESAGGFVDVSKVIPDAVFDIRYYTDYNFVGERIDGYEEPLAFLTKEAATALKKVSDAAKLLGYRLKIFDCYRPQCAVDHFVRWVSDPTAQSMKQYFYPDEDKTKLIELDYISPKSGHSRGSTVDLTLVYDETGRELDMGSSFDSFGKRSHSAYVGDLTEEQLSNRNVLKKLMREGGFRTIITEWWHFTLVDEPYPDTYFTFPINSDALSDF